MSFCAPPQSIRRWGNPGNDKKKIQTFADNAYVRLHGSNEGLEQLRSQVKELPLPPADFKISTATEIAEARRLEFEKDNPQLALWMKIKGALSDGSDPQYFDRELKDSAVPQLKGTLMGAEPECRSTELLVAVPLPDQQQSAPVEIRLKLDKPLAGKPDLKAEFQWEGVPSAFTREPFLLTMDVEAGKLQGLATTPCAPPAKNGARKKP
jgi:hypothetical protein